MVLEARYYQDTARHVKFAREVDCKDCLNLETVCGLRMCIVKPMIRGENLKKCKQFQISEEE